MAISFHLITLTFELFFPQLLVHADGSTFNAYTSTLVNYIHVLDRLRGNEFY